MIDDLGLTQVGLARLLNVNDTTVRRWVADGVPDGPPAILLALMYQRRMPTVRNIRGAHIPRPGPITAEQADRVRGKHKRAPAERSVRA